MIRDLKEFPLPMPIIGFNDTDNQLTLPPNVLVDILNLVFDRAGIKTRDGYSVYSSSGLPTNKPIRGAYTFKKADGSKFLLVACGADLYKETTPGIFSSIKSDLAEGNFWDFITLTNLAIMSDANNIPLKYDGTNCLPLKITPPSVSPSAIEGEAGSLSGAHYYKYTYVTLRGAETNGSSASNLVNPSNQVVHLSDFQSGGLEVVYIKIYRTTAGGKIFYYLATIENSKAHLGYIDNISDVELGTDIIPTDHDPPPDKLNHMEVYKEFLFGTDPDHPTRNYFSHQSFPEIFSTAEGTGYYVETGLNDGQAIIGRKTLRDMFYVFKERSTWPIIGSNPDEFRTTIQPISSSVGLYHRSIATVDAGTGDMLIGLARDGLYAFDGYTFKNIGFQKEKGINIQKFIDGLDKNKLHHAYGYNDVNKKQYRLCVTESGSGYNNKELVWDYKNNSFTIFDRKANIELEWNNIVFLFSSKPNGKVYREGGLNDDGEAITIKAEFPWWNVGGNLYARYQFLNIETTLQGDYAPVVNVYVDGSSVAHQISLESEPWGSSNWVTEGGTYRITKSLDIIGSDGMSLRGGNIKPEIIHTGLNQPLGIHGISLLYSPKRQLRRDQFKVDVLGEMGT